MVSAAFVFVFLLQPVQVPATQSAVKNTQSPTSLPKANPDAWKSLHRGVPFTLDKSTSMDELVKTASTLDGKTIRVDGTVKAVCRKKGCWMTLSGSEATSIARITFKDYSFFVPLKCAGSSASVEGVLKLKTLSDAERAHLAQDAGKAVKDVPQHELRIVASSVALTRQ